MTFSDYSLYFGLTLLLSTLFSMGGVGSAIALVPCFSMVGLSIDLAKSLGLFVNTASTATASMIGFRRGLLEMRFALPLVISVLITTPVGAWMSQYVARDMIEGLLIAFLVMAAMLLLFSKRAALVAYRRTWPLYLIGGGVGVLSGMLGVGGGALMMPALIVLGYDAKQAARAISFVIPFSSAGAFLTYLSFTEMNWRLLTVVAVAAIIGGYLGEKIMHHRLSATHIKKFIAVFLLLIATKMLWQLVT
ncbi:sulfite exporter TauE/SafE family protein [Cohaesibacter celericrescens]|uniref:sulfite exporter TauE/SafE family protein n=1 Tax=Cohaesibacter celericrescens TaxID=2067669 RepID=UPI00356A019C